MSYPIAYPAPPPTTNSLTSHQRSQLLRTTQKLGRILGTQPALIEETDEMPSNLPLNLQRLAVPMHIQLSSVYSDDDALRRYSSDTVSSTSSSYSHSRSSSERPRSSTPSKTRSVHANESYPERPFLRIALNKPPALDTIPQSPPAYSVDPPHSYSHSHSSYTLRAPPTFASAPPPSSPSFAALPSDSAVRRQKMDKLRRTLGEGVPLGMVFPSEQQPQMYGGHSYPQPVRAAPPPPPMSTSTSTRATREKKKLSMIAEREETSPAWMTGLSALSISDSRSSTDSSSSSSEEDVEQDPEAAFLPTHRRASRVYDGARRVKRVPVPAA